MRKHLFVTLLLACGMPLTGTFAAYASPEPQEQGQSVVTITGTVLDENNEPVIGASVVQKGVSSNAVSTNFDGNFSIRVKPGTTLRFSYVGYASTEIAAAQGMMVYLQPTTEQLNELVAIGYGTQKRANLTGAVATVDVARVVDSRSTTDITSALQGAVPGLTITNSTGEINGTPSVKIRGTGSLSNDQNTEPLYVVDGIIVEDISFLNPNDIADISVLKDAASSAIYGTRAAFGVILITTKNPNAKDRVSISYNNNFGWSQPTKTPDYPSVYEQIYALTQGNLMSGGEIGLFGMDPFEMMPLAQQWAIEHGGKKSGYREMVEYVDDQHVGDYKMTSSGNALYYADWDVAGIMFNNATPSNYHNVSLEGASGKTSYRLSFGYSKKQDLNQFNPATMRRYNGVATINTEIFSWWKAGARMSFSEKDYAGPYNVRGDYIYTWRWGSYFGPYGYWRDDETGEIIDARNDIAYRKQAGNFNDRVTETRMTAYMDFLPIKGLQIHADFNYNVTNYLQTVAYMPVYCMNTWGSIAGGPNYDAVPVSWADARQTNTKTDGWMMNVYATYGFTLKDDYNFKVMFGSTAEQQDYNYFYGKRDVLLDLDKPYTGLTTGGSDKTGYDLDQKIRHWATAGFFGRINFDYKGIYLFEFNGRYDGSTRFPANDQWAFFPSGSVGYRFSEEKYFEPVKEWWSNGKFRASYGEVGNTALGNDPKFLSVIGIPQSMAWLTGANAQTSYANMPTLVSSTLTWERVRTLDFGLDLGFMNNSLNVGFDWYSRTTDDMLGPGAELPAVLGDEAPYGNNGTLRTNGWELSLGWNHSFGDWDVYATATLSDARTKIVKWHNDSQVLYSWVRNQRNFTQGAYYGDIYGFETDRYFETGDINPETGSPYLDQTALESGSFHYGVGDIMFKDLDGNGRIDFGDPTMIELNGRYYVEGDAGYAEALADKDHTTVAVGSVHNHGDLKVIGNTQPRYEYSFRIGGAWKGFDLDIFFQGVGKRNLWYTGAFMVPFARGTDALYTNQTSYNEAVIDMNTQKLTGEILVDQNNDFARLYPGAGGQGQFAGLNGGRYSYYPQTRYLMNMAYLRLKSLTIGYTIPANLTQKVLIQKARVYFSADNLALLYNGLGDIPIDPEINSAGTFNRNDMSGANGNGYFGRTTPMPRTFSFGIQVTF